MTLESQVTGKGHLFLNPVLWLVTRIPHSVLWRVVIFSTKIVYDVKITKNKFLFTDMTWESKVGVKYS